LVPERIAHYRIIRRLGEGGMGTVFAAHDERLDRPAAVKIIRRELDDQSARQRFWQEARAAARVSHPNICQLYEIGEQDDMLFIAMEAPLAGDPRLDQLRQRSRELEQEIAARFVEAGGERLVGVRVARS
jgi:eukaryotic-like serine/threonine-protein kinase